jgi:hypothetical protein
MLGIVPFQCSGVWISLATRSGPCISLRRALPKLSSHRTLGVHGRERYQPHAERLSGRTAICSGTLLPRAVCRSLPSVPSSNTSFLSFAPEQPGVAGPGPPSLRQLLIGDQRFAGFDAEKGVEFGGPNLCYPTQGSFWTTLSRGRLDAEYSGISILKIHPLPAISCAVSVP